MGVGGLQVSGAVNYVPEFPRKSGEQPETSNCSFMKVARMKLTSRQLMGCTPLLSPPMLMHKTIGIAGLFKKNF